MSQPQNAVVVVLRRGKTSDPSKARQATGLAARALGRIPTSTKSPTSPLVEGVSGPFFSISFPARDTPPPTKRDLSIMPRAPGYEQNYINAQHEAAAYNGGAAAGQQPIMEDQQEVGEEGYGTSPHHSTLYFPRESFTSEGRVGIGSLACRWRRCRGG